MNKFGPVLIPLGQTDGATESLQTTVSLVKDKDVEMQLKITVSRVTLQTRIGCNHYL